MFMLKSTHEAEMREADERIVEAEIDAAQTIGKLNRELDEMTAKFKKAVKEIAGLTEDVGQAEKVADARARKIAELNAEIAALRPDAEKFRAKAKADAERKRNQRANAKSPAKKR